MGFWSMVSDQWHLNHKPTTTDHNPMTEMSTMTESFSTPGHEEIWRIVQEINDAWVSGRPEDLDKYFHKEIVFVAPGFAQRIEGRAACVDSFREFCAKATVRAFKPVDPAIDIFEGTALATYSFTVEYDLNNEIFNEGGRDLWVFVRDKDKWRAAWRTIIPAETN